MAELLLEYKIKKKTNKKYADKFKIMEKAMELSHGKANNEVLLPLLDSDGVTPEMIAKIANGFHTGEDTKGLFESSYSHSHTIWDEDRRRLYGRKWKERKGVDAHIAKKVLRDDKARSYRFTDTFVYRAMERFGLDAKSMVQNLDGESTYRIKEWAVLDSFNTGDSLHARFCVGHSPQYALSCTREFHVIDASSVGDLRSILSMYYHAPKDLREKITTDEKINLLFSSKAIVQKTKGYTPDSVESNITNDEWRKFQIERMVQEFDWLVNAPDDAKELLYFDINKYVSENSCWKYPLLTTLIIETFRYPSSDNNVEIVREAYDVMDYLGIGVVWNGKLDDNSPRDYRTVDGTGVGKMLKKVSSMMRRFRADVRKGYNPNDVRETVVEDLNIWVADKCCSRWKFFVKNGFTRDYSELYPQKKKSAKNETKLTEKDVTCSPNRGFATLGDWELVRNSNNEQDVEDEQR